MPNPETHEYIFWSLFILHGNPTWEPESQAVSSSCCRSAPGVCYNSVLLVNDIKLVKSSRDVALPTCFKAS